jgi:SPW repeat-containing protein
MSTWRRESVLDLYSLMVALFLFTSPWLFVFASENARIDIWASSALVAATSILAIVMFSSWEEWLNLLLGLWLVVSPWALGFTHTKAMHVSIGAGIVVTFMAALELWLVYNDPQQATAPR